MKGPTFMLVTKFFSWMSLIQERLERAHDSYSLKVSEYIIWLVGTVNE